MNHETFENLMRVQLKRKQQATAQGNWRAAAEAIKEIERLNNSVNVNKDDQNEYH